MAVATQPRPAAAVRPPRRRTTGSPVATTLAYVAAVVVVLVTVVPFLFVFIGGFRTTPQINASPAGLPHPWVLDNYVAIVTSGMFWRFMANSAIIAAIATVITVVCGAMAAFALSRYE